MIKRIKKLLTTLSLSTLLFVPTLALAPVHAQSDEISGNLCSGANLDATRLGSSGGANSCANDTQAANRVNDIIKLVINVFSLIVGVAAVIMIILGGFKYITSGGNDGSIAGAKNTILYAIIGLVVVALAQVIVKFVLSKSTV